MIRSADQENSSGDKYNDLLNAGDISFGAASEFMNTHELKYAVEDSKKKSTPLTKKSSTAKTINFKRKSRDYNEFFQEIAISDEVLNSPYMH